MDHIPSQNWKSRPSVGFPGKKPPKTYLGGSAFIPPAVRYGGIDLAALATSPPPSRARWFNPFALRYLGVGLTPEVFVSRWGLLTREMHLVPYARLQSVRVVQGPLQRRLGLATVYADTAGGRSGQAKDRDLAEAWALADALSTRARLARGPAPAVTDSPAPRQSDEYWQRPPTP